MTTPSLQQIIAAAIAAERAAEHAKATSTNVAVEKTIGEHDTAPAEAAQVPAEPAQEPPAAPAPIAQEPQQAAQAIAPDPLPNPFRWPAANG